MGIQLLPWPSRKGNNRKTQTINEVLDDRETLLLLLLLLSYTPQHHKWARF